MAEGTTKCFMGIPNNNKDTHRGDAIPTSIRKQDSHPSRGRAHKLPGGQL